MQVLNGWLKTIRADGMVLVRTRTTGPWGFSVEARDAVVFHFVAEGKAYIRQSSAQTIELGPGELVLLPRGDVHDVVYRPRAKAVPLEDFMAARDGVIDAGANGCILVCGEFGLDRHLALPALRALPMAVHIRAGSAPSAAALGDTLRLLRAEVETQNFGSEIVARNLLSMLFVYFMREWSSNVAGSEGWFAAIRAPQTARALACIHEAPERAWTLEDLAKQVGLSRSAFSRQFCATVGEPPHSYLTRWRMGIAAQLLRDTDLRLAEISSRVGYQSEFSFSRAFRRARGSAPSQFRRSRYVKS